MAEVVNFSGCNHDPMAVVDPLTMKVHGLEISRVVDASAMPHTTNGNIHAPVINAGRKSRGHHPRTGQ